MSGKVGHVDISRQRCRSCRHHRSQTAIAADTDIRRPTRIGRVFQLPRIRLVNAALRESGTSSVAKSEGSKIILAGSAGGIENVTADGYILSR